MGEPSQCSLWFEPQQWSKRYEETFYTCLVAGHLVREGTPAFVIQLHAGAINSWQVTKTTPELETFAQQLQAALQAQQESTTVPDLPAKKFSLLSEDTSAEYLTQRTGAYDKWLSATLGSSRKISALPCVRAFLELDRELVKEPDEEEEIDEPMATTEEAKAQ